MNKPLNKNEYLNRTIEFHKLYNKEIVPILKSYEFWRKRELLKFWGLMVAAILMTFAPLISFIGLISVPPVQEEGFIDLVMILSVFFMLVGIVLLCSNDIVAKNFTLTIKTDCLPKILKIFGGIKWVNNKNIITNSELDSCGLFANFNRRGTDDEFQGTYKGVPFRICETYMLHESGSGKNRSVVQIFKGVIIAFKANKKINNRTIVATKGDLTKKNNYWIYGASLLGLAAPIVGDILAGENVLGWIITLVIITALFGFIIANNSKNEEKLDEVKLEDPRFCDKFNAYSSDQVEARYLLTTSFIERFQNLKTAFGAKKAKCAFYGNQVMFAISTNKNLFEIGSLYKSLENPQNANTFYDELSSILRMAEYFKLDKKIGL